MQKGKRVWTSFCRSTPCNFSVGLDYDIAWKSTYKWVLRKLSRSGTGTKRWASTRMKRFFYTTYHLIITFQFSEPHRELRH